MNRTTLAFGFAAALAVGAACNIHDNTINARLDIPNATLNVTANADINNVKASQSVPLTVDAQNLVLVAPNDTPPAGHEADAVYLEFHLDDETNAALLVTAETSVTVTIPAGTAAGAHKIICRAHKHDDGSPTDVAFTLDITVTVSVNVHVDGGAPADAGPSRDAGAAKDGPPKRDGGETKDAGGKDAASNASAPSTALFP
jgi:hypothetical protein